MGSLEQFKIDLKGLKDELTQLSFDLNKDYFEALDETDVDNGALHVSLSIRKASGFFELHFHTVGTVDIPCDRCLDLMEQPIETDNRLVVKLGSTAREEDDTIVVDENEGILDVAWFIYEFIALAIPIQHVHAPGKCNPAMTQVLEELSADRSGDEESDDAIDPRWEKLLKLNVKSEE
jgi:Predicted metal-binding, possibly nucleic acid-binding protein